MQTIRTSAIRSARIIASRRRRPFEVPAVDSRVGTLEDWQGIRDDKPSFFEWTDEQLHRAMKTRDGYLGRVAGIDCYVSRDGHKMVRAS